MKVLFVMCISVMCIMCFGKDSKFKTEPYKDVDVEILNATPEEYQNKKINVIIIYNQYISSFPEYIERSGIKPSKYYGLAMQKLKLMVFGKKKGILEDIVPTLKRNTIIQVYGKVKRFSKSPAARIKGRVKLNTQYYIELNHIEVMENAKVEEKSSNNKNNKPRRKRPKRR